MGAWANSPSHLAKRMLKLGHEVAGNDNMIGGEKENLPKNIDFFEIDCTNYEKIKKIMKDCKVVYHCAATAHEGLSVFSPYTITKSIYGASVSTITAAIANKVITKTYAAELWRRRTSWNIKTVSTVLTAVIASYATAKTCPAITIWYTSTICTR